jgi:hypothetical protein
MHTYHGSNNGLWYVGYYVQSPSGTEWQPLREFKTENMAAAYVSYLNGGEPWSEWSESNEP